MAFSSTRISHNNLICMSYIKIFRKFFHNDFYGFFFYKKCPPYILINEDRSLLLFCGAIVQFPKTQATRLLFLPQALSSAREDKPLRVYALSVLYAAVAEQLAALGGA